MCVNEPDKDLNMVLDVVLWILAAEADAMQVRH
jgi:hypothetical protein